VQSRWATIKLIFSLGQVRAGRSAISKSWSALHCSNLTKAENQFNFPHCICTSFASASVSVPHVVPAPTMLYVLSASGSPSSHSSTSVSAAAASAASASAAFSSASVSEASAFCLPPSLPLFLLFFFLTKKILYRKRGRV
jgi:hypothetical protein